MNNGKMDRGNENPTQHLPWWLRETKKETIVRLVGIAIWTRDLTKTSPACYHCSTSFGYCVFVIKHSYLCDYNAFKIARGFKVKFLYRPLHTQWSVLIFLKLRSRTDIIIADRWGRERVTINCYVRYLQAGPLLGLSHGCRGRSYVVSSGRSTAGKSGHLHILQTSRETENTIVFVAWCEEFILF